MAEFENSGSEYINLCSNETIFWSSIQSIENPIFLFQLSVKLPVLAVK